MSTLHTLRSYVSKSRRLLDDADIVRLRWLFVAILAMAALEVAGIASILPF
ncbi:MAG: hypothetical protein HKO62_04010, partial [Gammaproteobacteria bacterium]|nr:hypothetical protein [Gammaproteobacteria bacterium]